MILSPSPHYLMRRTIIHAGWKLLSDQWLFLVGYISYKPTYIGTWVALWLDYIPTYPLCYLYLLPWWLFGQRASSSYRWREIESLMEQHIFIFMKLTFGHIIIKLNQLVELFGQCWITPITISLVINNINNTIILLYILGIYFFSFINNFS